MCSSWHNSSGIRKGFVSRHSLPYKVFLNWSPTKSTRRGRDFGVTSCTTEPVPTFVWHNYIVRSLTYSFHFLTNFSWKWNGWKQLSKREVTITHVLIVFICVVFFMENSLNTLSLFFFFNGVSALYSMIFYTKTHKGNIWLALSKSSMLPSEPNIDWSSHGAPWRSPWPPCHWGGLVRGHLPSSLTVCRSNLLCLRLNQLRALPY